MTHDDVAARLSEYLEGELPLRQRALVDAHLDACSSCRESLVDLRAAVDVLHDLGDAEPRARIADLVMERIRAGEAQPSFWSRVLEALEAMTQPRVLRPVALAAVGAVVLVAARPELGSMVVRALTGASRETSAPVSVAAIERETRPPLIGASGLDREPPREVVRLGAWGPGFGLPHTIELSRSQASLHMRPILMATPIVPVSPPRPRLDALDAYAPRPESFPARAPSDVPHVTPVDLRVPAR